VSFDAQRTPQGLHVAAAVVLHSVLEEYESAFRTAGCSPGVVLPSSLGAMGAVNEEQPTMLLKIGQDATSIAVVQDGQLLLFRILEGSGSGALTAERMADDIYPSMVYFQDNYGASVEQLLVSGAHELNELAGALEQQTGVKVRELIGPDVVQEKLRSDFAGAIGALL
jgi:Tfp pilus assembly PilM family ATPase